VRFEWDDAKNLLNQEKHGISFGEARRLFESGVDYLEIFDIEHSDVEDLVSPAILSPAPELASARGYGGGDEASAVL
jgi:hypothetical protein